MFIYTKQEEQKVLVPLLKKIYQWRQPGKTTIIGIQGGQGTGKTTLVHFLQEVLQRAGYKVVSFSLDDFYTSWKERQQLAEKHLHNPFYQISRGMPGTHRLELLKKILQALKEGRTAEIPIFDKSLHQGAGDIAKQTRKVSGRQDFILFEGWCLGLPVVENKELKRICQKNKIDLQNLDPKLKYSKEVLQFAKKYRSLWKYLDKIVMLKPSSSGLHLQWRLQQEKELQEKKGSGMDPEQVKRFVEPFLPFTYLCYEKVKPDVRILISKEHKMYEMEEK